MPSLTQTKSQTKDAVNLEVHDGALVPKAPNLDLPLVHLQDIQEVGRHLKKEKNLQAKEEDKALQLALQSADVASLSPVIPGLLQHGVLVKPDSQLQDTHQQALAFCPSDSGEHSLIPVSPCVGGCRVPAALDLASVAMSESWQETGWLQLKTKTVAVAFGLGSKDTGRKKCSWSSWRKKTNYTTH